jgi:hypothetical protein
MIRFTLHVPEQYNDGTNVGREVLGEIEYLLLSYVGGFTLTHGIGAWRSDDGTIYRESVRLYAADSDDPDVGEKLQRLAARVADALRQEAVYLTTAVIGTELVVPTHA